VNWPGTLGYVFIYYIPPVISNLVNSSPFRITYVVLLLFSHIAIISGIVTGIITLTQAGRYPSPKPRVILAGWGVALGFVGIVIVCVLDALAILSTAA
jgi:hypothetical protein